MVFQFWAEHIHPEDRHLILEVNRKLNEGGTDRVTADYRYQHPKRGLIWIHHLAHVVDRDAAKQAVRTIGVMQDITERKQAELEVARSGAEIAHLSRSAVLGELSGSLAHELNQPLAAILSNAQAAQRFLADDHVDIDEIRDILNDIVAEDRRAGEVIRRLRMLLKRGEVNHLPLNLRDVVQDALKLARNDMLNLGITLHTELASDLPVVEGDSVQLQQVLLNLVANAADAMAQTAPAEKHLFVRTEHLGEDAVRVSVSDSGPGMTPETLNNLFSPFFTTKPSGMGLGLKVCRTIIAAHGGQLDGKNNAERGATFQFTLPAAKKGKP